MNTLNMSDCCIATTCNKKNTKETCPGNRKEYKSVGFKTVLHHIKKPCVNILQDAPYYFCDDPVCDVVYFNAQNEQITQQQVRTTVGIKSRQANDLVCYCFDVTFADAEKDPQIKEFVTEQTKLKRCDCENRNPSGKCCLKDFPKP